MKIEINNEEIILTIKGKAIKGRIVLWNNNDGGYKLHAGSVYFDGYKYSGFINHDGTVLLNKNLRRLGLFKTKNLTS